MRHYQVFLKKEIIESIRSKKLPIILSVFLILGILNPLTAKMAPEIIKKLMPGGEQIVLPEPSAIDCLEQFFKNTKQTGLIVILLTFSGILVNEIAKGRLLNLLSKGLKRDAVILAKLSSTALIWTCSLLLEFALTWLYTVNLFSTAEIENLFAAVSAIWLFGLLLLSLLIFASVLTYSTYKSLLIVAISFVFATIMNLPESFQKYNPLTLATKNIDLIKNTIAPSDIYESFIVTALLIITLTLAAAAIFRKKPITAQ